MEKAFNFIVKAYSKMFDWAVFKTDRPRKRWHNLFYNSIAFYADLSLLILHSLKHYYYKFTLPYGLSDTSENS